MSGSPGNTNPGTQGGRAPRHGNDDVIARHRQGEHQQEQGGSAEESARGTITGRNDSRRADPDTPGEDD
jgi:hypothetical protein